MATATAVDLRRGTGRRPWLPALMWLPVLGLFFFWSYGLANTAASRLPYVPSLSFGWEKWVPFLPWTIVPYWTSDALYVASVLVCTTRRELNTQVKRLIAGQLISIACFLAFPLRCIFERPVTHGFFGWLFDVLLGFDKPFNQAPSLHVSLAVILWFRFAQHLTGFWRAAMGTWLVLVSLSTMTTFQHHFLDLPTGALAGLLTVALFPDSTTNQRLRLATFYFSGAVLAAAIVVKFGGFAWLLAWPVAACLVVSIAYAANLPALFRNPIIRVIAAPYTAAAWLNSRFWTRGLEPAQEVADGVWLGRAPFGSTTFHSIVSLAPELNVRARTIPVLDLVEPTDAQLKEAVNAIEAAQRPTLVCCALGFSRSASAVAAWLVATGRARSTAEANALIHRKRPHIVLPLVKEEVHARRV